MWGDTVCWGHGVLGARCAGCVRCAGARCAGARCAGGARTTTKDGTVDRRREKRDTAGEGNSRRRMGLGFAVDGDPKGTDKTQGV